MLFSLRKFLIIVQGYYSTQSYYDTWATLFHLIFDEYEWPPYEGPSIMPSESMKRTSCGLPKSSSLHNEMDVREGKTTITYGFCKQPSHNRRLFEIGIKLIETCCIYILVLAYLFIIIDCYIL